MKILEPSLFQNLMNQQKALSCEIVHSNKYCCTCSKHACSSYYVGMVFVYRNPRHIRTRTVVSLIYAGAQKYPLVKRGQKRSSCACFYKTGIPFTLLSMVYYIFGLNLILLYVVALNKVIFFYCQKPMSFIMAGPLLARLIPRCTDPVIAIRQTAVDCVQCVLKIAARFEGI